MSGLTNTDGLTATDNVTGSTIDSSTISNSPISGSTGSFTTVSAGNTVKFDGGYIGRVRVHAVSGNVGVTNSDFVLVVSKAFAEATLVQLPQTPTNGSTFYVKDGGGNAATSNITVTVSASANLIDGAGTSVLSTNFQCRQYIYDSVATQYRVI